MNKKAQAPGFSSRPKRSVSRPVVLEPVFLKLESTVKPTWDHPEPSDYITPLAGNIYLSSDDADEGTALGTIRAYSVHLGNASEDGVSWFEVLDSHSGDLALYLDLFDTDASWYSEWVESNLEPYSSDLLILDRIRVEPPYRGKGYGLYAAELLIQSFAPAGGLAACVPAPYELLQKHRLPGGQDAIRLRRENEIPEWGPAEAKLRDLWSLLGFQPVPASDVWALSLSFQRPTMQDVLQRYFERKSLPTDRIQ